MPLKHSTETLLVIVLGALIVLTGIVTSVLPALPAGSIGWGVAFVLSLAYPLSLYPLLKSSRADYPFRALHFVPAGMLVLWLFLQVGASYLPWLGVLQRIYTWGWTAIAVIPSLLALAWFCVLVIRQYVTRLGFLAALAGFFIVVAGLGEGMGWPQQMTAVVARSWNGFIGRQGSGVVAVPGSSSSSSRPIAMASSVSAPAVSSSSAVSSASADRSAYRRRLHILDLGGDSTNSSMVASSVSSRVSSSVASVSSARSASSVFAAATSSTPGAASGASRGFLARLSAWLWGAPAIDRSSGAIVASASSISSRVSSVASSSVSVRSASSSTVSSSSVSTTSSRSSSTSSSRAVAVSSASSSKPQHLPQTGFGLGEAALLLVAGYCGVLHNRARRATRA